MQSMIWFIPDYQYSQTDIKAFKYLFYSNLSSVYNTADHCKNAVILLKAYGNRSFDFLQTNLVEIPMYMKS